MTDPSLAEIVRRLDELREMLRSIETTYTRADVYAAQRAGDRAEVKSLRDDVESLTAQRRQLVMLAVSGLVLPVIVAIVVALVLGGGTA